MNISITEDINGQKYVRVEQEPCNTDTCKVVKAYMNGWDKPNNSDAISRQAVLKTLDDMDNVLDEDRTIENYKELLKECYEVLPPVKPQEPKTDILDKIRAEIAEYKDDKIIHVERNEMIDIVLEIIDKYRGEEL